MLFKNQKFVNGILIGGDLDLESIKNGINTSNNVLDPGMFRGAHINKELFSVEDGFERDSRFFAEIDLIDQNIIEIIDDIKEIGNKYDLRYIYDKSPQKNIDDAFVIAKEKIIEKHNVSPDYSNRIKTLEKEAKRLSADAKKEAVSSVAQVQTIEVVSSSGFTDLEYYRDIPNNSQQAFEIKEYLSKDSLKNNFTTNNGIRFSSYAVNDFKIYESSGGCYE